MVATRSLGPVRRVVAGRLCLERAAADGGAVNKPLLTNTQLYSSINSAASGTAQARMVTRGEVP